MATTEDFILYVCEQINDIGVVRPLKMFGEYTIYVNEKPIILVCDNIVYIKIDKSVEHLMGNAEQAVPYKGAKARYILDIDNKSFAQSVLSILEKSSPMPMPKLKPKAKPKNKINNNK